MENGEHKKKNYFGIFFLVLFLLGLVAAIAGLGYLYYQTRLELKFLSSPAGQEELSKRSTEQVLEALGKLALLPSEEPVIATITDVDSLASQSAFYLKAQNGDKLVVFPQAQQAYIYSPARNIIVNVGPLIIEGNEENSLEQEDATLPTPKRSPSPTPEVTVEPTP
jgi:hypothetical protein